MRVSKIKQQRGSEVVVILVALLRYTNSKNEFLREIIIRYISTSSSSSFVIEREMWKKELM